MSFFGILFFFVSALVILCIYRKLTLAQIILSVLSGIAAIISCDVIMSFAGNNMPINIYTVAISAVGGIPFVILLVLLKTFLL